MLKSVRRLAVLKIHLQNVSGSHAVSSSNAKPSLTIKPQRCLVDEKIRIQLTGLSSHQLVTLVADVTENGRTFESRCLYRSDENGVVDSWVNESLGGSFSGYYYIFTF